MSSPARELGVEEHRGRIYFSSDREGGKGGFDIYSAAVLPNGFGPVRPVEGPFNSVDNDSDFTLSAEGKTALFWRDTAKGPALIYCSQWKRGRWTIPQPLSAAINRGDFNFTPSLSRDARTLWFASTAERPGQDKGLADIYVTHFNQNFHCGTRNLAARRR